MKYKPKSEAWFKKRIGKRIYRDDNGCTCGDCKQITETGLTVHDDNHAWYLALTDNDYASGGKFLNYRDEKANNI